MPPKKRDKKFSQLIEDFNAITDWARKSHIDVIHQEKALIRRKLMLYLKLRKSLISLPSPLSSLLPFLPPSSSEVCHSARNDLLWAGNVSCIGCPNNFCAGDRPSFWHGVFRYCRRAFVILSWQIFRPFHAIAMIFFIAFMVASALPLL